MDTFSLDILSKYSLKTVRRWKQYQHQSQFELTPFKLHDVLAEVRAQLFPEISTPIHCVYTHGLKLAYIQSPTTERASAQIVFHSIFNHPKTPKEIIRHVMIHELIHLTIPSREVEGRVISHPPEFWETQKSLDPQHRDLWDWLWSNFYTLIVNNREMQETWVDPRYAWEHVRQKDRIGIEQAREEGRPWREIEAKFAALI